ncbi:hypothetical protein ATCC90586_002776 [Pythium insidiosum]|nr:hypothetical protein ATCC90586_002776 [Pythium insidiosum]
MPASQYDTREAPFETLDLGAATPTCASAIRTVILRVVLKRSDSSVCCGDVTMPKESPEARPTEVAHLNMSLRSMNSSTNLRDGRPEPVISRSPRSKSQWKSNRKSIAPLRPEPPKADNDEEDILFLNNSSSFDFRAFFDRAKSVPNLHRQSAGATTNAKRRLRSHEELCLVVHKPHGKSSGSSHSHRKAWFLFPGFIGRESGEHVHIVTKEPSMDPIHAEITVDGDDYLLRDRHSSGGTFLCLSTTNRHQPQRDGFRLRQGDTFCLGSGAQVVINELTTTPKIKSDHAPLKKSSTKSRLERRLTDQHVLERSSSQLRKQGSRLRQNQKSVHFEDALVKAGKPPDYELNLPADGGVVFPAGPRYRRKTKPTTPVYAELAPGSLRVTVMAAEAAEDLTTIALGPKMCYTIGSSPWCDIQIASEGINPVHARIVFDGHFFVLQDLSFEGNPLLKTRVLLSQPTRIGRGDILLFGKCSMQVVNVYRAFRDHEPDLKEVAFKCHLLRPSKRKSRRRDKYLPVAFKNHQSDTLVVGKGSSCDGQVFTASLCVEQFAIQLDSGQCSLTPRFAGINQGMYFLLGRNSILHETKYKPDVIRYTSKALMLVEGSVFRIGSSEVEVTYVKLEDSVDAMSRADEIRENTQFLKLMPWMQQISMDRHSLENIAKRAQRLQLESGDNIYDEGDPAAFLFVVLGGEVEMTSVQRNRRSSGGTNRSSSSTSLTATQPMGGGGGINVVPNGKAQEKECIIEVVSTGSYFGEASLWGADMEYAESAKALSPTQLLVLSREDVCGYLTYYMDIIRPHLTYETHKDLLHKLRLCVPWCSSITYQELRSIAAKAERLYFQQDDFILRNGEFWRNGKRRYGLLLLRYGAVDVVDADGKRLAPAPSTVSFTEPADEVAETLERDAQDGDASADELELAPLPSRAPVVDNAASPSTLYEWPIEQPITLLAGQNVPPEFTHLRARTGVQCFYIDVSAFQHLLHSPESRAGSGLSLVKKAATGAPAPILRRRSTTRRSSYATQFRARHSQVITSALHAQGHEDGDNLLENADLEDLNDPSRKWRRKKRNKNLLEKTILETQQSSELLNALVLYVLSGANRGDIHVVRNVATIGSLLSSADIEFNDRYVSPQHAVIEHREGRYWLYDTFSEWGTFVRLEENQSVQIFPGDVFLAGEVEFTCMGAFPERKKTAMCVIQ